ncbi:MAG TPA: PIG-L deacetylase family protein [Pseudonocardiaceae bacterium]|jgi:LmbE family N-acetylglucosaminyl deacetylase|nr:PIG-L deacetylase family protein [Pseudonocardiaceae bacterium]
MRPLRPTEIDRIAVLGAHCDDIAIGAGGSLLTLCEANPGVGVDALVLTGGGSLRAAEEQAALSAFCPLAKLELTVLDLPDGRLPTHWEAAKQAVEDLRRRSDPQLLFAPHPRDAHQDHRTVAEIVPTAFRDHLVFGYEIIKWDGDAHQPSVYQPLSDEFAMRKAELLVEHYPSQHGKDWFDRETFLGLARLRGVQCHARYAEAFHLAKMIVDFGG